MMWLLNKVVEIDVAVERLFRPNFRKVTKSGKISKVWMNTILREDYKHAKRFNIDMSDDEWVAETCRDALRLPLYRAEKGIEEMPDDELTRRIIELSKSVE